jgi:single-stranded-DNA-specific exonuclease
VRWRYRIPDTEKSAELARALGRPHKFGQLLYVRGLGEESAARDFLAADLKDLPRPESLPGMDRAAELCLSAFRENSLVAVSGDYDVDGLTATALLSRVLGSLGFRVISRIPNRMDEGYGLSPAAVEELAAKGAGLLITVDSGVSDLEAAEAAAALSLPMIITDHHRLPPVLPKAAAIVNPHLGGGWERYPLAGVGVAFMLAWAVSRKMREGGLGQASPTLLVENLSLVALGTIADMAPLFGPNRILVRHGLRFLSQAPWPSIQALKKCSRLDGLGPVSVRDVGFKLAPRLNAAGRMGSAQPALELLTTEDPAQASELARRLDDLNRLRQEGQNRLLGQVLALLEAEDDPASRTVVLAGENWPKGLLGLVASRVAERARKPAILFSLEDGLAIGSGRTAHGFNLFAALSSVRHLCLSLGGHSEAAGLKLPRASLSEFREAFEQAAMGQSLAAPEEELWIDFEASLGDMAVLLGLLSELGPFGQGHPAPVAVVRGLKILEAASRSGHWSKEVRVRLSDGFGHISLTGPGLAGRMEELEPVMDVAVAFDTSAYGQNGPSWRLVDFKPPGASPLAI